MYDARTRGLERSGFTALATLLLSPVIAHGLWRPLAHVFGPAGSAATLTILALGIAVAAISAEHLRGRRARWSPLLSGGLIATGASAGLALGFPGLGALVSVAAASAWLVRWLPSRLPPAVDGLVKRHRVLAALYTVAALAAVVSTGRLSVFVGDPTRVDQQVLPGIEFVETHSCLTAYVRAATLARQGVDNLYDERFWLGSNGLPPRPAGAPNPYRPFLLDHYSYPPTFLLVMTPLLPMEGDFLAQRALWFGLNGLLLALGLWTLARWIDGPGAHRVLLLAPLLFGSLPILVTLQIGNFQIASVVIAVLAMVAFERGRAATGGALLALTALSKLSPAVLGAVLLAQRRFRSAATTAGFGVLLVALSTIGFGTNPLRSFLAYAVPRLRSGAAFAFMGTDSGIATNLAPFGLPFKLRFLGLAVGDPWRLGRHISQAYLLGLVLLTVVAARKSGDRRTRALTWLSLLVLASLQSPFAPAYVAVGLLWAMTLLAVEVRGLAGGVGLVLLALLVNIVPPGHHLPHLVLQSMAQMALIIGVCVWIIVRRPRAPAAGAPADPRGEP